MTNLEKYIKAFAESLEVAPDQVPALKYGESDQWDSVGHMSLIAALEDAFDISIPAVEIIPANFNSAGAMWEMIQRLQDED